MEKLIVYKDVYGSVSEPEHTQYEYEVGETISVDRYDNKYRCMKKEVVNGDLIQYFSQGKKTYTFDY